MVAPELPYDITFSISEYLDDSVADRRSLMALALSSKSFLPICQERLFSSIILKEKDADSDSDSKQDRIGHLAKVLETSPHLRHYIRSLTYKNGIESNGHPSFESVADIISALHKLQELRLSFSRKFDWSCDLLCSGALKFTRAVQDAVKSPSLSTIHLHMVTNFPISLFTSKCKELLVAEDGPSSISLSVIKSIDEPMTPFERSALLIRGYEVGKTSWPRPMQHKIIDGINYLGSDCPTVPSLDLRFLERLSLTLTAEEDLQEANKIQALARSIQSIQIEAARRTNFDGVAEFLQGSQLTLHTLILSFSVTCRNDPWGSLLREVTALADQSLPALKRLVITTSHCSCGNIPSSDLERLDKALVSGGYPSLRTVVLTIKVRQSTLDELELDIPGIYGRYLSRVDNVNGIELVVSTKLENSE